MRPYESCYVTQKIPFSTQTTYVFSEFVDIIVHLYTEDDKQSKYLYAL